MNKYNQLREEIILAVPEIMELKFGCEVEMQRDRLFSSDPFVPTRWKIVNTRQHFPYLEIIFIGISETLNYGEKKKRTINLNAIERGFKIIGRPISLEDCLIAIEGKHLIAEISVRVDGTFYKHRTAEILGHWKPNIPLQDQSELTINLLWDLICKK